MRVRAAACMFAAASLLANAGCGREAARLREHERTRADSLGHALAALAGDSASVQRPEWPAPSAAFRRAVPEWDGYRAALDSCWRDLAVVAEMSGRRDVGGVTGGALEGWRRSSALAARSATMMNEMNRLLAVQDGRAFDATMLAFRAHTQIHGLAISFAGDFLRVLRSIVVFGAPADRAAVFGQLAAEYPRTERRGLASALGGMLQAAWSREDDPAVRSQMEARLQEVGLPLVAPSGSTTASGSAGPSPPR